MAWLLGSVPGGHRPQSEALGARRLKPASTPATHLVNQTRKKGSANQDQLFINPAWPGSTPPGTKAIRRANLRLGHWAPGRGGRRARTVFWLRELRVSQQISTFYGSSVQAMDTQFGATDGGPCESTEVVLRAPRAEPDAETPAAFWKKRQGSRKIKLSGKKTAVGADRTRVAAGFFVLHNGGHGPCLEVHALRRGRRGPTGTDRTAR